MPRAETWRCSMCENTGFLVYASTLHNVGWLPEDTSTYGLELGQRVLQAGRIACYSPATLLNGEFPAPLVVDVQPFSSDFEESVISVCNVYG